VVSSVRFLNVEAGLLDGATEGTADFYAWIGGAAGASRVAPE
jgi:hypothetical protein